MHLRGVAKILFLFPFLMSLSATYLYAEEDERQGSGSGPTPTVSPARTAMPAQSAAVMTSMPRVFHEIYSLVERIDQYLDHKTSALGASMEILSSNQTQLLIYLRAMKKDLNADGQTVAGGQVESPTPLQQAQKKLEKDLYSRFVQSMAKLLAESTLLLNAQDAYALKKAFEGVSTPQKGDGDVPQIYQDIISELISLLVRAKIQMGHDGWISLANNNAMQLDPKHRWSLALIRDYIDVYTPGTTAVPDQKPVSTDLLRRCTSLALLRLYPAPMKAFDYLMNEIKKLNAASRFDSERDQEIGSDPRSGSKLVRALLLAKEMTVDHLDHSVGSDALQIVYEVLKDRAEYLENYGRLGDQRVEADTVIFQALDFLASVQIPEARGMVLRIAFGELGAVLRQQAALALLKHRNNFGKFFDSPIGIRLLEKQAKAELIFAGSTPLHLQRGDAQAEMAAASPLATPSFFTRLHCLLFLKVRAPMPNPLDARTLEIRAKQRHAEAMREAEGLF